MRRSDTPKASGKGKQPKRFLELNLRTPALISLYAVTYAAQPQDSLQLASSISDAQEQKALEKAEKHHKAQAGQPKPETTPRISALKAKLKETKALLAAQKARSKNDRAKKRKRGTQETLTSDGDQSVRPDGAPGKPARKKVSFAFDWLH